MQHSTALEIPVRAQGSHTYDSLAGLTRASYRATPNQFLAKVHLDRHQ